MMKRPKGKRVKSPIPLVNRSSIDIPPFAVLEVVTVEGSTGMVSVRRPTKDGATRIVFNLGGFIPANGGQGFGAVNYPVRALYDDDDGLPGTGEAWGSAAGSFKLKKGKFGLRAVSGSMAGPSGLFFPETTCSKTRSTGYGGYSSESFYDCMGCLRSKTASIAISRPLFTGVICNPAPAGLPIFYSCSDTWTYDGTMTWSTKKFQGINISPANGCPGDEEGYAPCCEGFYGVVCGDYCWEMCDIERTGYWSEEIVEETGIYMYCGLDNLGPGLCGPRSHWTTRYCMYPVCNPDPNNPGIYWLLDRVVFAEDYYCCSLNEDGSLNAWVPNPSPAPCYNVDCQVNIGSSGPYNCEKINHTFDAFGSITIIED